MECGLIERINKKYSKSTKQNYWDKSIFRDIVELSNDERGRWGEEITFDLIREYTDFDVFWLKDQNTNLVDGVYDLWVEKSANLKSRIEVKTSGRTISKGTPMGWQHENVYFGDSPWDKITFIDYDSDNVIYITVLDYNQVVNNDVIDLSIFGKKAHCRKNEKGKAKVDFSMKSIRMGIQAGVTFAYYVNQPDDENLRKFLVDKFL